MKENINYSISGSHGFIGGAFHERLTREGHSVKRIGRYATAYRDTDVVIDCAAYGNMSEHGDVSEIYEANVHRAINQILIHKGVGYSAYIFISTSSVSLPHQTYYSASKRATEEFIAIHARESNKPVVAVRPYSLTGVGEQREHLIPTLIDAAYTGAEIPFVPRPVHDFIDKDDFVEGVLTVAKNADQLKGQVIPIGSGKQTSNQHILDIVESITNRKINHVLVDSLRDYDTKEWVADTTLMYSLGWKPKKTLEESITEMVEEYERACNTNNI